MSDVVDLFQPRPRAIGLEEILSSADYFGLDTISPLQRAICRCLDGLPLGPELEADEEVIGAFGGPEAVAALPRCRPSEFVLLAGIRCGKSLISAAGAVRAALTCDVSRLSAGDVPRVSILSLSLDTATATWNHVRGHVEASHKLRTRLLKPPTTDTMLLEHPSGRPIEIKVVAGSRAAGSLVARWAAGIIFDEAPRMVGSEDGVVNIDDARQATIGRLLPGAQIMMIGSPWAPFGPVYDLVHEHFGKPNSGLVIVRAPSFAMNPSHWTPEKCDELRTKSPDAYHTDVLCGFMDPVAGLFTTNELESATRQSPVDLPPNTRYSYAAAIDPATRGNGWALVVTTNLGKVNGRDKYAVALSRQWVGSKSAPLNPREVFTEIADLLRPYRLHSLMTDQWAVDTLREIASQCGLGLIEVPITRQRKFELFDALKLKIVDQSLELGPDPVLIRDLASVRKRVTQSAISIELPDGADGRHADYAVALALALSRSVLTPGPEEPDEAEKMRMEQIAMREQARRAVKNRLAAGWRGYR